MEKTSKSRKYVENERNVKNFKNMWRENCGEYEKNQKHEKSQKR